jgi:hypothetical protein
MSDRLASIVRPIAVVSLAAGLAGAWSLGCAGGDATMALLAAGLFGRSNIFTGGSDPNRGDLGSAGALGGGSRATGDACDEALDRKFVTISMRSLVEEDHVHYFMVLIAFVQTETTEGAVCPDDVATYTRFGYTQIPAGSEQAFGNFCIEGPALVYYHRQGRFRSAGGTLESAIAPARGSDATFDTFFTSAGARVPIPDIIAFHNPGTGGGAGLLISRHATNPCGEEITSGVAGPCSQDGFYYVSDEDIMTGSNALGSGSGRRVPSEIQGTGCECAGFAVPWAVLAPTGASASDATCFEFLRGGRIEFVFIRQDEDPPIPQLVWRVTDASGQVVHDFDRRVNIP